MPRNPIAGFISGVFGLGWAALGLALAAWAAIAALDPARGLELALWAQRNAPFALPWEPAAGASYVMGYVLPAAVVAAVALLFAWSNLRTARIAFRPRGESQDGKGELQLAATQPPRVGKPFDGSIRLREAPGAGEEFDVVLTARKAGTARVHRFEQAVRARQGAHGVHLPFRFEVPATMPPSGRDYRWRLEFAPAGKRGFGRSWFDIDMGAAPEHELRAPQPARVPLAEAAPMMAAAAAPAPAQGYVEQIEKLYGALGGKLTEAQRAQLHAKLAEPGAHGMKEPLEALRKVSPRHLKILKYAFIGAIVVFFVLPFALGILGMILGAVFG